MPVSVYPSSRTQAERTIAAARVALAITSLFAIWIDPAEPARFAPLTYGLQGLYVLYSIALAIFTWSARGSSSMRLSLGTHIFDIIAFSVFQYLTLGPSSPFFIYFIFSTFCAAIRWGWRGALSTGIVVVVAFLLMATSISRTVGAGSAFEMNRFIIRTMYLCVTAALLVYLGRYEERLRDEIERLARWPNAAGHDIGQAMRDVVEHAGRLMRAARIAVVWDAFDEPWVNVVTWDAVQGTTISRRAPTQMDDPLPDFSPQEVVSIPFQAVRLKGRVFFVPAGAPAEEIAPLAEVVAREIGSSFDQLHVSHKLRDVAAREERIRLARDLHDGVLQSLTGIRLELRAIAGEADGDTARTRDRLNAIERALGIEQRELRFFIADLKPPSTRPDEASLAGRLDALRERIALEWKAPVTITIAPEAQPVTAEVSQAVPLMVHEAVVNALKHGDPSRVTVNVAATDGELRITVADDGHGFPFKGRYDHAALSRSSIGPRSLFDRVTAFGGRMAIDSSDAGSRVEMVLSL